MDGDQVRWVTATGGADRPSEWLLKGPAPDEVRRALGSPGLRDLIADLGYHQGVEATVTAVASGGYETNPDQFLKVDPRAQHRHLRGYPE